MSSRPIPPNDTQRNQHQSGDTVTRIHSSGETLASPLAFSDFGYALHGEPFEATSNHLIFDDVPDVMFEHEFHRFIDPHVRISTHFSSSDYTATPDLNYFESPDLFSDDPDSTILNTPAFMENGLIDTFNPDNEHALFPSIRIPPSPSVANISPHDFNVDSLFDPGSAPSTGTVPFDFLGPPTPGTRKNVDPDALIPLSPPAQLGQWGAVSPTPSSQSIHLCNRPEVKAPVRNQKEGKDNGIKPPGPSPTERETIEQKRQRNLDAARRSRLRRSERLKGKEEEQRATTDGSGQREPMEKSVKGSREGIPRVLSTESVSSVTFVDDEGPDFKLGLLKPDPTEDVEHKRRPAAMNLESWKMDIRDQHLIVEGGMMVQGVGGEEESIPSYENKPAVSNKDKHVTSSKETFASVSQARLVASVGDDNRHDQGVEALKLNSTEREAVEDKTAQNTFATRRSMKRKLEYMTELERRLETVQLDPVRGKDERCITADEASSHAYLMEPALREALADAGFEGEYMIQVGFNDTMLFQGTLLEQIFLLLDGNLNMTEDDVCTVFAPIFSPFPAIIYTQGQTHHVPIDLPSDGTAGRRLDSEGKVRKVGDRRTGSSGDGNDMEGVEFTGSSGSSAGQGDSGGNGENSPGSQRPGGHKPYGGDGDDDPDDDDDDDGGKGGGYSGKGKGKLRRGPRIISIPLNSTLSIQGASDESHRFHIAAGIDITANEDKAIPPIGSEWGGPWFKVDITKLEANSLLAAAAQDQTTYHLSFTQVRVIASSRPGSLTQLDRSPKSSPKEVDFARMITSTSRGFHHEMALGMNPTLKSGVSTDQTSGVERSTSRWNIASHPDTDAADGDPGMESDIAIWKYVHNDAIFHRVEGWTFDRDICPSVTFGFKRIKTDVQVEMTAFWSSKHDAQEGKTLRRDFPILWRRAKANKSIFCNFVYQVEAVVDLEKVPHERSWIMPRKKPHILEKEMLTTTKGPIDLGMSTTVAEKYSKSGQLEEVLSTNCEVIMKAVVEGRVDALTVTERKGQRALTLGQTLSAPSILTPSPSPQSEERVLTRIHRPGEVHGDSIGAPQKKRKM